MSGDMVIMSMETYEKTMFLNQVYQAVEVAEQEVNKINKSILE